MQKKTGGRQFTTEEKRFQSDYDWARHDATVQAKYQGQVIAVRQQTVIAAARTLVELQAILEQRNDRALGRAVVVLVGI